MKPYYDDGIVTIYHGDCREVAGLVAFDAVVTDPPYGIGYQPNGSIPKSRVYDPVVGDDEPFDPAWILARNVPTIMWGANHYASRLPDEKGWLVWWKHAYYVADVEMAWTNLGGRPALFDHEWRGATRRTEHGEHYHPTQKPTALMVWCLDRLPNRGGGCVRPVHGCGFYSRRRETVGAVCRGC